VRTAVNCVVIGRQADDGFHRLGVIGVTVRVAQMSRFDKQLLV
jgi:hypothetical protein